METQNPKEDIGNRIESILKESLVTLTAGEIAQKVVRHIAVKFNVIESELHSDSRFEEVEDFHGTGTGKWQLYDPELDHDAENKPTLEYVADKIIEVFESNRGRLYENFIIEETKLHAELIRHALTHDSRFKIIDDEKFKDEDKYGLLVEYNKEEVSKPAIIFSIEIVPELSRCLHEHCRENGYHIKEAVRRLLWGFVKGEIKIGSIEGEPMAQDEWDRIHKS